MLPKCVSNSCDVHLKGTKVSIDNEGVKCDGEIFKGDPINSNNSKTDPKNSNNSKTDPINSNNSKTDPKNSNNSKTDPINSNNSKTDPINGNNSKTDPINSNNSKTDPKNSNNSKTDPLSGINSRNEPLNGNNSFTESHLKQNSSDSNTKPVSKINSFTLRNDSFVGCEPVIPIRSDIIQTNKCFKEDLNDPQTNQKESNIPGITKENDRCSSPSNSNFDKRNTFVNRNSEKNLNKNIPVNGKYEIITASPSRNIPSTSLPVTDSKGAGSNPIEAGIVSSVVDKDITSEMDSTEDACNTKKINVPIFAFEKTKLRDIISLLGCKLIENSNSLKCQFPNTSRDGLGNNYEIKKELVNSSYDTTQENRRECKPEYIISISPDDDNNKTKNTSSSERLGNEKEKAGVFKDINNVSSSFEISEITTKDGSKMFQLDKTDDDFKSAGNESLSNRSIDSAKIIDKNYTLKKAGVLFALTDMIRSGSNRLAQSGVLEMTETSRVSTLGSTNVSITRDKKYLGVPNAKLGEERSMSVSSDVADDSKLCSETPQKYGQKIQKKRNAEENRENRSYASVKRQDSSTSFICADDRNSNRNSEKQTKSKFAEQFTFEIPRFAHFSIEEMDDKSTEPNQSTSLPKMTNYRISLQKELLSPSSTSVLGSSETQGKKSNTSLRIEGKLTGQEQCSITKSVCDFITGKYAMNETKDGNHSKRDIRFRFDEEEVNIYRQRSNNVTTYMRPNKRNAEGTSNETLPSTDLSEEKMKTTYCTTETDDSSGGGAMSLSNSPNLSTERLKDAAVVIDNDLMTTSVVDKIACTQSNSLGGVENFFYDPLAYIIESMSYSFVDSRIREEEIFCKENNKTKRDSEPISKETRKIVTGKIIVKDRNNVSGEEAEKEIEENIHHITLNTKRNDDESNKKGTFCLHEDGKSYQEKNDGTEGPKTTPSKQDINDSETLLLQSLVSPRKDNDISFGLLSGHHLSNVDISFSCIAPDKSITNCRIERHGINIEPNGDKISDVYSTCIDLGNISSNGSKRGNEHVTSNNKNNNDNNNTQRFLAPFKEEPRDSLKNPPPTAQDAASYNDAISDNEARADCRTKPSNPNTKDEEFLGCSFPEIPRIPTNIPTEVKCETNDINFSLSDTTTAKSRQNSITISVDDVTTTGNKFCEDGETNEDIRYIQENLARYIMENVANITYPKPSDLIGISYNVVDASNDPIEKAFKRHYTEMCINRRRQSTTSNSPEILDRVRNSTTNGIPFQKTIEDCLDIVKMDISNVSNARIGMKDYVTCVSINVGDNTCYIQKNTIQQAELKVANNANATEKLVTLNEGTTGQEISEKSELISEEFTESKDKMVGSIEMPEVSSENSRNFYNVSENTSIEPLQNIHDGSPKTFIIEPAKIMVNGKKKSFDKNHCIGSEDNLEDSCEDILQGEVLPGFKSAGLEETSGKNNGSLAIEVKDTEDSEQPDISLFQTSVCRDSSEKNQSSETNPENIISDSNQTIIMDSSLKNLAETLVNKASYECGAGGAGAGSAGGGAGAEVVSQDIDNETKTKKDTEPRTITEESQRIETLNPSEVIENQCSINNNGKKEPFTVEASEEPVQESNEFPISGKSNEVTENHNNSKTNPQNRNCGIGPRIKQNDSVDVLRRKLPKENQDDSIPMNSCPTQDSCHPQRITCNALPDCADDMNISEHGSNIYDNTNSASISVDKNILTSVSGNLSRKQTMPKTEPTIPNLKFDKYILDQIIETNSFPMLSENGLSYSFNSILNPLEFIVIKSSDSTERNEKSEISENFENSKETTDAIDDIEINNKHIPPLPLPSSPPPPPPPRSESSSKEELCHVVSVYENIPQIVLTSCISTTPTKPTHDKRFDKICSNNQSCSDSNGKNGTSEIRSDDGNCLKNVDPSIILEANSAENGILLKNCEKISKITSQVNGKYSTNHISYKTSERNTKISRVKQNVMRSNPVKLEKHKNGIFYLEPINKNKRSITDKISIMGNSPDKKAKPSYNKKDINNKNLPYVDSDGSELDKERNSSNSIEIPENNIKENMAKLSPNDTQEMTRFSPKDMPEILKMGAQFLPKESPQPTQIPNFLSSDKKLWFPSQFLEKGSKAEIMTSANVNIESNLEFCEEQNIFINDSKERESSTTNTFETYSERTTTTLKVTQDIKTISNMSVETLPESSTSPHLVNRIYSPNGRTSEISEENITINNSDCEESPKNDTNKSSKNVFSDKDDEFSIAVPTATPLGNSDEKDTHIATATSLDKDNNNTVKNNQTKPSQATKKQKIPIRNQTRKAKTNYVCSENTTISQRKCKSSSPKKAPSRKTPEMESLKNTPDSTIGGGNSERSFGNNRKNTSQNGDNKKFPVNNLKKCLKVRKPETKSNNCDDSTEEHSSANSKCESVKKQVKFEEAIVIKPEKQYVELTKSVEHDNNKRIKKANLRRFEKIREKINKQMKLIKGDRLLRKLKNFQRSRTRYEDIDKPRSPRPYMPPYRLDNRYYNDLDSDIRERILDIEGNPYSSPVNMISNDPVHLPKIL
ncbi:hypothetical protein Ahia01_000963400 [Argonauta hians]